MRLSPIISVGILLSLWFSGATAQEGFAIVSSNDTLNGKRVCYQPCVDDETCVQAEAGRCVELPSVGSVCMPLRPENAPPTGHTTCEENANICIQGQLCGREPGPTLVETFVEHKRNRGFDVHVVDESTWGGGEDGIAKASNLRAWLQGNYQALDLRYLLIIGDPRQSGDVPMALTKPGLHAEQGWATGPPLNISTEAVSTDFYFAELTGNWDLDNDGNLAEFAPINLNDPSTSGDFGEGGTERDAELSVGRIPYYGVPTDLDNILQKTMDYENTPIEDTEWRQSVLLAAEGANRLFFGEQVRNDILLPNAFDSYRVYDAHLCSEFGGANENCSDIDGTPDELHCSVPNVASGIDDFRPGLVMWLTHGGGQGAAAVMNGASAAALSDSQPFFTFQASCLNSIPRSTSNISYRLLKNGAIGTVGATVISHGPGSEVDLTNDAGNAGMAYAFAQRMVQEQMSAGDALSDLRRDIDVRNRWWYWRNYMAFNLWGDPSVGLYSFGVVAQPQDPDMGVAPAMDAGIPDAEVASLMDSEVQSSMDTGIDDSDAATTATTEVDAAAMARDAEAPPADMGIDNEAAAPTDGTDSDAGCDCTIKRSTPPALPLLLLVLSLGAIGRVRRRPHGL